MFDIVELFNRMDAQGNVPHTLRLAEGLSAEVLAVGGWELTAPKALPDGSWVYRGWKLKLYGADKITVNGEALPTVSKTAYCTVDTTGDVVIAKEA